MTAPLALTSDDIASGGTITVENIRSIEVVLDQMWRAAAESSRGAGDSEKGVTRVCLGNVVAVTDQDRVGEILDTLDRLSVRRPSRVIVAEVGEKSEAPGIRASIRAVCHLPAPGAPQVCCEQIHLECANDSAGLLPAVVASLLEPDLPTVLWWDRDLIEHEEFFIKLAEETGTLLFDMEAVKRYDGIRDLRRKMVNVEVHDLAWMRIEPWRRALARVFDDGVMLPFLSTVKNARVKIESNSFHSEIDRAPAVGLLFLGWLMGQLGLKCVSPLCAEGDGMCAVVSGAAGEIHLLIERGEAWMSNAPLPCPLESVSLQNGRETSVLIERLNESGTIGVSVECPNSCPLVRRVAAVSPTADQIIGDVLGSSLHSDPIYIKAVEQALSLLEM